MSTEFSTVLSSRISKAANILDSYVLKSRWDDGESFLRAVLADLGLGVNCGAEDEACLRLLELEDFTDALNALATETLPIPKLRLKLIFNTIKGIEQTTPETQVKQESNLETLIKTMKPISQCSNQELLEAYNKECPSSIQEELAKRSKGRYAIIFKEDGFLDIENSLYMLKKCNFQDTPATFKLKSGDVREVYRVGDFPMQVFYECPLHSHTLLLGGYCEECGNYWDTDNNERNVFFRLLGRHKKIEAHEVSLTYKDMEISKLISLFPKVHLEYKRLAEEGNLPNLKRRISGPKSGDPFRVIGTNKVF
jgi:hypothetical protein